jgi:UV excision repair protein RAD23
MKITVKNIHQQTFTVEIDASRKVRELKILLANNIPEYPANNQYIIYAGRIMHDEQVLGNYSFDSSRFLVVMNRPPIQHQMNVTTLQNVAAPSRPITETRPMEEIPVRDNDEENARPTEASGGNERDYIITGTEKYIEVCRSLIDMGYPDQDVEMAMSKAFNNPERAVEYLLQGE